MVRTLRSLVGVGIALSGLASSQAGDVIRKLTLDESAPVVDLFEGMTAGQLQVKLLANSANDAVVSIKNKTDAPLTVALPKAAVGIPVLPQLAPLQGNFGNNLGNQFNNNPGAGANNGRANQAIGGQFQPQGNQQAFPNANGNGNPGQGIGPNMFSIPPEKIVQLKMRTVCLDYGLPDPNVGVKYELRKLESEISDPVLRQLLEDYSPRTDQHVMQAAAWHLANGLSWDQIANLPSTESPLVETAMFTSDTVKGAKSFLKQTEERATKRAKEPAPIRAVVRPVAARQTIRDR